MTAEDDQAIRRAMSIICRDTPTPPSYEEVVAVGIGESARRLRKAKRVRWSSVALVLATALGVLLLLTLGTNEAGVPQSSQTGRERALVAAIEAMKVTASPTDDLTVGEAVTIEGTGLPPGAQVPALGSGLPTGERITAFQCANTASSTSGTVCGNRVGAQINDQGDFSATMYVVRDLSPSNSVNVDCAESTSPCFIKVVLSPWVIRAGSSLQVVSKIPIKFAASVRETPSPTITVTPSGPYTAGDVVTIAGANFPPSTLLNFGECPANVDCVDWLKQVTTDASGSFSVQLALQSTFMLNPPVNGQTSLTCTNISDGCHVFAAPTRGPEGSEVPIAVSP